MMDLELSPEEYFRRQAAAALLQSEDDSADDNSKEAWSEIDDNSGTDDDETILVMKRRLRYGRKKMLDTSEHFNAHKEKLFEARNHQLDLELVQLKNGTHPQYKEYVEQVDARWSSRLAMIEQRMECGRELAQKKLESSQRAVRNTFVASRGELRQAMILRRKKQVWTLTDDLRNLEKIRQAIVSIACPLSNSAEQDGPAKPSIAPADSAHMLSMADTRLNKLDEDADVATICRIPALLNYSDAELAVPEDGISATIPGGYAAVAAAAGEAADIRVPGSQSSYVDYGAVDPTAYGGYQGIDATEGDEGMPGGSIVVGETANGQQQQVFKTSAYGSHQTPHEGHMGPYYAADSRHESTAAAAAAAASAAASSAANGAPSAAGASAYGAGPASVGVNQGPSSTYYQQDAYQQQQQQQQPYYERDEYDYKSGSNPRMADIVHGSAVLDSDGMAYPSATSYGSRKQPPPAYGNSRGPEEYHSPGYYEGSMPPAALAKQQAAGSSGASKREYADGYDDMSSSTKRQRVMQPSNTWSAGSSYYQQGYGQSQPYPSQQGRYEWQEPAPHSMQDAGRYHHGADPDMSLPSYGYGRQPEYYSKYASAANETTGHSNGYHQPQYSQPPPISGGDQVAAYHYSQRQQQQQQQPDYSRHGAPSSYYSSQQYDYATEAGGYYQQQQQQQMYMSGHESSAAYYQTPSRPYHQQAQVNGSMGIATAAGAGAHQSSGDPYGQQGYTHHHQQHASNSSYSGLDAGISMPPPSRSSNWGDYYSKHPSSHAYGSTPHQHGAGPGPGPGLAAPSSSATAGSAAVGAVAAGARAQQPHMRFSSSSYHGQQPQHEGHHQGGDYYGNGPTGMHSVQHHHSSQAQSQSQPQHPQPQPRVVDQYHHRQTATTGGDGHHYSSSLTNALK
ncbi:hypothetical protein GGI07_001920 [Coemansia sp. Benny D115]|nr:hypothetical protein GGI07_001920 [Coemansia sp. Benny D115]